MVITSGTVHQGSIAIDATQLPDGARVTILAPDGDETFLLREEQEAKLLAAIHEANHGRLLPASEVLASLRRS